jgi:hypothetical protein
LYRDIPLSVLLPLLLLLEYKSKALALVFERFTVIWVSHFRSHSLAFTFFPFFPGRQETPPGCSQTNVSDSASQSLSRVSSWHWHGERSHRKILLHRKNQPQPRNLPPRLKSLKPNPTISPPNPPQSLQPPTQESR